MLRILILLLLTMMIYTCNPKMAEKELPEAEAPLPAARAFVLRESVNLRREDNTQSPVIKQLKDGEEVQIIQNRNGWYEVRDAENQLGWLRSDLVGPSELSRTLLAAAFVDSILPRYQSQMYFDSQKLFQTVYLILPDPYYASSDSVSGYATEIGRLYQEQVYPGKLEIRVMSRGSENPEMRLHLPAIAKADIPLPILSSGRLISLKEADGEISIGIAVKEDLQDKDLLKLARRVSGFYELPFSKVEIFIVQDSVPGVEYLLAKKGKLADTDPYLLYYLEDKDGEYFHYNDSR